MVSLSQNNEKCFFLLRFIVCMFSIPPSLTSTVNRITSCEFTLSSQISHKMSEPKLKS